MGEHAKDARFAALYGLMVVEARITERLDAELEARAGIPRARLELLLHLPLQYARRARRPARGPRRHPTLAPRAAPAPALEGRPAPHVRPRRRAPAFPRRRHQSS